MIQSIRIQYFRSYKDDSFEFEPGVNIIVGSNASGKTNLLEGLLVACQGKSYRAADKELVAHNSKWARLDLSSESTNRTIKIATCQNGKTQKTLEIDGKLITRPTLENTVPLVLFEPEHLQLLIGSPLLRRDYLDDLLEKTVVGFLDLRSRYKRTLLQRNALLKKGVRFLEQLFVWNVRLSELGDTIASHRQELVKKINTSLTDLYQNLSSSKTKATIKYISSCDTAQYGSSMLKKLESGAELDFIRGFTAYGPHRDDINIYINEKMASITASRGETRTLLLGLKIFELKIIEETRGQKPIVLLDDVFSELDGKRRKVLTEHLKGYQVFITTTDADVVIKHFADTCHILPVS